MNKRIARFNAVWGPKKGEWALCVGFSYNYWNPMGGDYVGTHIFSVHIAVITLRWSWE